MLYVSVNKIFFIDFLHYPPASISKSYCNIQNRKYIMLNGFILISVIRIEMTSFSMKPQNTFYMCLARLRSWKIFFNYIINIVHQNVACNICTKIINKINIRVIFYANIKLKYHSPLMDRNTSKNTISNYLKRFCTLFITIYWCTKKRPFEILWVETVLASRLWVNIFSLFLIA